jgi:EAL and modified HD-GYP domain-containing signal transduction protein
MPTPAQTASPEKSSACIARQPILTADEKMFGYELLFRSSPTEEHFNSDAENATGTAIDTLNMIGLDVLCNGYIAFINCTLQMLLQEYFLLLPAHEVVVEVQETVPVDAAVIQACQRLQNSGYAIALDNFVPGDAREALIPHASFLKVDIQNVSPEQCASLVARYANTHCRMLAHKVESRLQFSRAKRDGFSEFQGYFFHHPERMRARQIPGNQATYLLLLDAISKPEADFHEIEDLIKREPSLCYRLLRYLNSPLLGIATPVVSIRHALNLLGERELVRWIRMATTLVMGQKKPSDLVLSALVRARFCELLGPKIKHGDSDLFLLGMLSLMDAILEAPIGVVVEKLSLDADTKAQLLGGKRGETTPLSSVYDLMVAREAGDWEKVTGLGKQLNLSLYFIDKTYNEAMCWAHQATTEIRSDPAKR